jgi:uncharacterized membrane protein YbhN (UPF0104 family)
MNFQEIKKINKKFNLINKFKLFAIMASVIYTFIYLFSQDELINKVIIHLDEMNIIVLIFALFAHIAVQLLAALRLKILIKFKEDVIVSLDRLYMITIMSNFMTQLLPSASAFSEGVRVALLKNKLGSYKKIIKIGIIDKAYGISGLIILSFFAAILANNAEYDFKNLFLPMLVLPYYLYNKCMARPNHNNMIVVGVLLCSYLTWLLNCAIVVIISSSIMGREVYDLINFLAAIVLIISNTLPIGFAGFGGQQIISGHMYSMISMGQEHGIAVSLVYGLFSIISNTFQAGIVYFAKIINDAKYKKFDHR